MLPSLRLALIGKPNCGKTALFNALTGARQKVANYPGVTVERREGRAIFPNGRAITLMDLPGIYSLEAASYDEEITRNVLQARSLTVQPPDALLCIADATNLRICLHLVWECLQLGKPRSLFINMADVAARRGGAINTRALSDALGIPVFLGSATVPGGLDALSHFLADYTPRPNGALRVTSSDEAVALAEITPPRHSHGSDGLDRILLHPVLGHLVLALVMLGIFQAVFNLAEAPMGWIESAFTWLGEMAAAHIGGETLRSLVVDGILAGVGGVLIFLPQILILFAFILVLEESGYLARAAVLLDRTMGRVGLHGKAFIPLLSSFACAIPGMMATRTIENPRDRLLTILLAPLMTCAARLPVYTLVIAAFVPNVAVWGGLRLQGLVMLGLYLLAIVSALVVAAIFRKTMLKGDQPPLMLELPDYRWPYWRSIVMGLAERAMVFITRAGTIILALMILIWAASSYPAAPIGAEKPAIYYSFAGMLGQFLAPLFAPLGFDWQMVVALIPAMMAREVAVAALGTVYALSDFSADAPESLIALLSHAWSLPTALAFLAWFVYAPQCVATFGVMRRETNSWKWTLFGFAYLFLLAYAVSAAVYAVTDWWIS